MRVKKKSILLKDEDQIKNTLLRHIFFTSYRSKGRRNFMLLKTNRYIQVGLKKTKKRQSLTFKYLLYKTLQFTFNNNSTNKDYLSVIKVKNKRDDFSLNLKKKKSVLGLFDSFYYNRLLNVKNFVPILITKFEYNLYDKNYNLLRYYNYQNVKKNNILYLQSYNYIIYNYLYFSNLYSNIKNIIYINLYNVISSYSLYLNTGNITNIFSIFKILKSTKFKYVKFGINNYIKFKNEVNIKHVKLLDKYLIKNKMFRTGKFFYHFLEYMKNFSYNVYRNNLFYSKYKSIKLDGNKYNVKLISFNVDRFVRLKGWFSIYNYIKKYSYLSYNENKHKVFYYFIKKCHFFYYFIIRFFYKIIKNLKFLFIDKFNFKKINFFKIVVFYTFYNKWLKLKPFIRLLRKKKLKRWKIKRIFKFRHLGYIRFLLRIKNRLLTSKFIAQLKLNRLIKKRKRLHYFKYKNTIRVVNWLLKLRKLKSIKNPFKKPFRRFRMMNNVDLNKNKNVLKLNKINKFKQLSNNKNNNNNKRVDYKNYRKTTINRFNKTNVKRF